MLWMLQLKLKLCLVIKIRCSEHWLDLVLKIRCRSHCCSCICSCWYQNRCCSWRHLLKLMSASANFQLKLSSTVWMFLVKIDWMFLVKIDVNWQILFNALMDWTFTSILVCDSPWLITFLPPNLILFFCLKSQHVVARLFTLF